MNFPKFVRKHVSDGNLCDIVVKFFGPKDFASKENLPRDDLACEEHLRAGLVAYFQRKNIPFEDCYSIKHSIIDHAKRNAPLDSLREIFFDYIFDERPLPRDDIYCRTVIESVIATYRENSIDC